MANTNIVLNVDEELLATLKTTSYAKQKRLKPLLQHNEKRTKCLVYTRSNGLSPDPSESFNIGKKGEQNKQRTHFRECKS